MQNAINKKRVAMRQKGPETKYQRRVGYVVKEGHKRRRLDEEPAGVEGEKDTQT